jgi:hypothetical protein
MFVLILLSAILTLSDFARLLSQRARGEAFEVEVKDFRNQVRQSRERRDIVPGTQTHPGTLGYVPDKTLCS